MVELDGWIAIPTLAFCWLSLFFILPPTLGSKGFSFVTRTGWMLGLLNWYCESSWSIFDGVLF
ncbi:hypothetical protein DL98DRAFT_81512 [Cadophora sp. DSE1049]|nr:hypothetical protein DL98DRAFT_81512 [Cadophora sp. DSE1049]